jgi:endonuclease/exonuclease/phosphatase family metal-dependent hydrolase
MRLVTLNTWKGDGDYRRRLRLIAADLARLAPDMVCLQESLCTADGRLDTAGYLARRLGYECAWAPARYKRRLIEGRSWSCHSGLAMLARGAIARQGRIALPSHPRDPERLAQWIDITAQGRRWRFVNLHLTHLRKADAIRAEQLDTLLAHLHRNGSPDLVWLCGDFNAAPEDAAMRVLEDRADWGIADAYTAAGGRPPGNTHPAGAAGSDGRRIDRVLVLTRNGARAPHFGQASIVLNTPGTDGVYPSDHAGVLIETNPRPRGLSNSNRPLTGI